VELLGRLRSDGYQLVAVEQAHSSVLYTSSGVYRPPLALIFGHERAGVTTAALQMADVCVEVPVFGMANSLNVAMACSVVGYEILRQQDAFDLQKL
jgi:tRNA G18 (ribose-2'-O)-methylase SpoU